MIQSLMAFKKNISSHQVGILFTLLVVVLSSLGWLFTKIALREFDAVSFIAGRFFLAAMLLLPFTWRELRSFSQLQLLRSCKAGLLLAIAFCLWIVGMNLIQNIGEAAFIVSLSVVFVPLISVLLGDKMGLYLWLALIPAVTGLYLLTGAHGLYLQRSQIILLLSAFCFSCHIVYSSRATKGIPSLALTVVQLYIVALFALAVCVYQGTIAHTFEEAISPYSWLMFICAAVFATSLRYGLLTKALVLIPPQEASMLSSLISILTAIFGWWFLDERMGSIQLMGCALIFMAQPIYRYGQTKLALN